MRYTLGSACVALWAVGSCIFRGAVAAAATPTAEPSIAQVEIDFAAHAYSVPALESHYEARIKSLDWHGPQLRSVLELDPTAPELASLLEHRAELQRDL